MTPVERAEGALRTLVSAVERELRSLDAVTERVAEAAGLTTASSADGPARAYLAVELHKYYTGLESILERIVKVLDGNMPRGDHWHQELLEQAATPIEEIRPPIVDSETAIELSKLLSFRHFFRHAYAVELDWDKLEQHRARVARCHPAAVAGIRACVDHMRSAISALTS